MWLLIIFYTFSPFVPWIWFVSWHVEVNFKLYTSASVLRFSLDWSWLGIGSHSTSYSLFSYHPVSLSLSIVCCVNIEIDSVFISRFSAPPHHRTTTMPQLWLGQGQVLLILILAAARLERCVLCPGRVLWFRLCLLCFMFVPSCCRRCPTGWWWCLFMQVDYGVWFWL